jgi:beta-glucanase (GH16 family)
LKIATKHEKTTARAWDEKKGFIQKEFEYSSDVLQTADTFKLKYGVIRAKIRCTGNAHHAFWLGSEGKLPHVNIFHFDGKKIQVGNANKTVFDSAVVTGINASDFYIYTLMWNKKELIWMINDVEIYRTSSNVPNEEMFLTLNSFIPEKSHGGAGSLEVDWIRVYAN